MEEHGDEYGPKCRAINNPWSLSKSQFHADQVNSIGMYNDNIDEKSRVNEWSSEEGIYKCYPTIGGGCNLDQ